MNIQLFGYFLFFACLAVALGAGLEMHVRRWRLNRNYRKSAVNESNN